MNTFIWILQILMACLFLFSGINKLFLPKSQLLEKGMKGLANLADNQIKIVGILEVLGVMGLILPALLSIFPIVTSIAACCLGLIMVPAGIAHYKLKLPILMNVFVFICCMVIAYHYLLTVSILCFGKASQMVLRPDKPTLFGRAV
jgi:uncharacterized membrane protein YphA (DoxX/SURF4 family)